jgi:trimeric autotransporter adhesin
MSMRVCVAGLVLALAGGAVAQAQQQFVISTVAGGAPPVTPAAAVSVNIGQPAFTAVDISGNLYFSALNSVFRRDSKGNVVVVAGNSRAGFSGDGGPATSAQLDDPQGLALDPAGNLYISDSGNNRVRIVTPDGTINTFAGTGSVNTFGYQGDGGPAAQAQLHLPAGLAFAAGSLYIADAGNQAVRQVASDGTITTLAGAWYAGLKGDTLTAIGALLAQPQSVAVDSSGNIYIADTGNSRIRKITTDGNINTIAGGGTITEVGVNGDGDKATNAVLTAPVGLVVDSAGNIYFSEYIGGRIRQVDSKGVINTIAGTGTAGFGGDGGAAKSAQFNGPRGIALDASGTLYIADSLNGRVRAFSGTGNVSTLAGNGGAASSGDGAAAVKAQLNFPRGVAVDGSGNLYIADTANNKVRVVSPQGVISTVAGTGSAGSGGDGGAAASAQLSSPLGVAVDAKGNLYIADTGNSRVRMVSTQGVISTVAGNGTAGLAGDGGQAASAQLNLPAAVAVDSSGALYIADYINNRVRMVSPAGVISTIAGNGIAGYTGDGGLGVNSGLSLPLGVAVDAAGNLYIADTGNNRIRLLSGGVLSTVAGTGVPAYSDDSAPASASDLAAPSTVAVDSSGNLYLADATNRVRVVTKNGRIATVAGSGVAGYSGDGAAATAATLNGPAGIAIGSAGNLYVADSLNSAVRGLAPAGAAAPKDSDTPQN